VFSTFVDKFCGKVGEAAYSPPFTVLFSEPLPQQLHHAAEYDVTIAPQQPNLAVSSLLWSRTTR